jgi:sugar lactone lactonase YvrE
LVVLDKTGLKVYRFDPMLKPLSSFTFAGNEGLVDIAAHPQGGTLVFLVNGKVLLVDDKGTARKTLPGIEDERLLRPGREPGSLSVDPFGTVIVTYPDAGRVARYDIDAGLTGVRGAGLWSKQSELVAVDRQGNMCSMDPSGGVIHHYDNQGWVTSVLAWNDDKGRTQFDEPVAMKMSPDGKYLSVLDAGLAQVVRFDLQQPGHLPVRFGQAGKNVGQFDDPVDLCVDAEGRVYVADQDLHKIKVFDQDGGVHLEFGDYADEDKDEELDEPAVLTVSADGTAVYVYDAGKDHVKKYEIDHTARQARLVGFTGVKGSENLGELARPVKMAVDGVGLLYIGDSSRRDVQVWDFRGNNAVALLAQPMKALGLSDLKAIDVAADGLLLMAGSGGLRRSRWYQESR